MPDDTLDEVRRFIAREIGVPADRVGPTTSLFHDLGVDGADGLELIEAFGARFGVDLSAFEAARHFGPEASWNPLAWLRRARTWPRRGMLPITPRDLAAAARSRRWQTPTHPARPST